MLVLSRKLKESIYIGDNVVVTVLEIRGNKARIGIEAPREVSVIRSELQPQVANPTVNGSHAKVTPAEPYAPPDIETDRPDG